MSDRRPAQTIGELDIHLGFVMDELRDIRGTLGPLVTRAEVDRRFAEMEAKVKDGSPRSFWKLITEIAVGVAACAAASGVVVTVIRFLKL